MTYVDEGPNGAHGLDGLGGLELAAEPEVDELDVAGRVEHDVLHFNVAVDVPRVVHVLDAQHDLCQQHPCFVLMEALLSFLYAVHELWSVIRQIIIDAICLR